VGPQQPLGTQGRNLCLTEIRPLHSTHRVVGFNAEFHPSLQGAAVLLATVGVDAVLEDGHKRVTVALELGIPTLQVTINQRQFSRNRRVKWPIQPCTESTAESSERGGAQRRSGGG
jgi:hypothetical protein